MRLSRSDKGKSQKQPEIRPNAQIERTRSKQKLPIAFAAKFTSLDLLDCVP